MARARCHLLGFRFAPRIRDLADRRVYVVDARTTYRALAPIIGLGEGRLGQQVLHAVRERLFGQPTRVVQARTRSRGTIDLRIIADNWDEILRLAASIKVGTVTPSVILRRLAAYPRQNALAKALREIGREGCMGSRNLTDAAPSLRRGGSDSTVARTCRATGEAFLVPARNRRSRVDRITGSTGKSIEGERVTDGFAVAVRRGNARGAKEPCCL